MNRFIVAAFLLFSVAPTVLATEKKQDTAYRKNIVVARYSSERTIVSVVVTGSAMENGSSVAMKELKPNGTSTGIFECYQRLQTGTYYIKGIDDKGAEVVLGKGTYGNVVVDGDAFTVSESAVVRMRYDSKAGKLTVMPVELYLKGNIVKGAVKVAYAGNGIFSQEVTLDDSGVFLFSDKYFYFAFNNSDDLAVKRMSGSRTAVAMPSEGFATENIRINGGKYSVTLDMNDYSWNVSAPIDEYKISAFGSSVCNGQGATDNKGYAYLYGQQLTKRYSGGISSMPFTVSGVAIGGNTTVNLLDRYDEMIHDFGKYVIIGLSMGNEGIHGASNQQAIFNQFRDNMLKLIDKMKADGKTVVVMNNYTRGDYTADDYGYIKRMNMLIHQWDVASVNTLGAIDNGEGKWADGYEADPYHPTTAGHQQFMSAIPTSLFDALEQGKPQPERDQTQSVTLENGAVIRFSGESAIYPYTLSVRIKGTEDGTVFSFSTIGSKEAKVTVTDGGHLKYTSVSGEEIVSAEPVITDKDKWYDITLTSYYAQKRTLLYCNKVCVGELNERVRPLKFTVGDHEKALHRQYSELSFWRSAMNETEISGWVDGKMLKSSLDIYSPLSEDTKNGKITNCAQSLNEADYIEGTVADGIEEKVSAVKNSKFYTLTGVGLPASKSGVNIECRDDGSSRSVLVR